MGTFYLGAVKVQQLLTLFHHFKPTLNRHLKHKKQWSHSHTKHRNCNFPCPFSLWMQRLWELSWVPGQCHPTATSKCHSLVLETEFRCLCPAGTVHKQVELSALKIVLFFCEELLSKAGTQQLHGHGLASPPTTATRTSLAELWIKNILFLPCLNPAPLELYPASFSPGELAEAAGEIHKPHFNYLLILQQ